MAVVLLNFFNIITPLFSIHFSWHINHLKFSQVFAEIKKYLQ